MPRATASSTAARSSCTSTLAPGSVNAHRVVRPAPGRTARIGHDHGVTVGGEKLLLEIELIGILRLRTAVRPEQSRIFPAGLFVRRMNQETVHLGAVRALEFCFLDPAELDLREERVVLFRQATQPVASRPRKFRKGRSGVLARTMTLPFAAHIVSRDFATAADHGHRRLAGQRLRLRSRHAHQCFGAVVLQHDEDRFPVGRPMRLDDVAVELLRSASSPRRQPPE